MNGSFEAAPSGPAGIYDATYESIEGNAPMYETVDPPTAPTYANPMTLNPEYGSTRTFTVDMLQLPRANMGVTLDESAYVSVG
jgi:hypothetical protein